MLAFYDTKRHETKKERESSAQIDLRLFNNFIKSSLIADALQGTRRASVLDLCGGRGGDLQKYVHAAVGEVYLIDISSASVEEARFRYKKLSTKFRATFLCGDAFDLDFVSAYVPKLHFQLVSCQFALHYAPSIEAVFRVVCWALGQGGKFIATFPNAEIIKDKLSQSDEWMSDSFRIVKHTPHSYLFTMGDAVQNVEERYVDPHQVVQLAIKYGMSVEYFGRFQNYFEAHQQDERAKSLVPCYCNDLYLALVLRKN